MWGLLVVDMDHPQQEDFYDLLGEKVIRKRKAAAGDDRAPKLGVVST